MLIYKIKKCTYF